MFSSKRSIKWAIAIGLFASLNASYLRGGQLWAADVIEFKFEDMSIPLSIDELTEWSKGLTVDSTKKDQKSTDTGIWLNVLGFESRFGLSKFLQAPLVKENGIVHQLLRSWAGRKLLDEVSDLVRLGQDTSGTKVFNTLESLLESQSEVSALDLLKALPAEVIHFDLDGWVKVAASWRDELEKHKKLLVDLRGTSNELNKINEAENFSNDIKESKFELISLNVGHRNDPLNLEVWNPSSRGLSRKSWVVFMPGLGGDKNHFRWLARSLSHQGWPVVILDHPGSDSKALNLLKEGSLPFPGGAEVFPYRLADLHSAIQAKENGEIDIPGESVTLIGHSLGSLTAFFASGAIPEQGLDLRCKEALDNFSITNLSRWLQCQLVDVPIANDEKKIRKIEALIGINSFGSLLWSSYSSAEIKVPVFLIGGTFDLITPPRTEQLGLLLSTTINPLSRALIIEGGSHFSSIRIGEKNDDFNDLDFFKLDDSLIGAHPFSVQSLLSSQIIDFLHKLELKKGLEVSSNNINYKLRFHILDSIRIKDMVKLKPNSKPLDL